MKLLHSILNKLPSKWLSNMSFVIVDILLSRCSEDDWIFKSGDDDDDKGGYKGSF